MDPDFLQPQASAYLTSKLPALTPVMERLTREAEAERQPAVNPASGALLQVLAAASGGGRALEIGTNLGLGSLWLLGGMRDDGDVETIEIEPKMVERARMAFHEAGVSRRVKVHEGAALDVLPKLRPTFDIIFIDCIKEEMVEYLQHAMRLARVGGIIVADNLLWHGKTWDASVKDQGTEAIREYTRLIMTDPRLRSTIVPTGDGMGVSVLLS